MQIGNHRSRRILLVFLLALLLGLLAACDRTVENDAQAPEAASPETLARTVCHDAWLATLDSPDAVEIDPMEEWSVEVQPNDTLMVRMSGRVRDTLGEMVEASWECVVLPDGRGMRLISLNVVKL